MQDLKALGLALTAVCLIAVSNSSAHRAESPTTITTKATDATSLFRSSGKSAKSIRTTPRFDVSQEDGVLIYEDFSLMNAGSEETPDDEHLIDPNADVWYLPSEYTQEPGWIGMGIYQAGGTCALNYPDYGGYINTPEGDYSGTLTISFRTKRLAHDTSKQAAVYVGVCSGGITSSSPTILSYQSFTVTNDWTEYSFTVDITKSTSDEFVQFNTYNYILIDDIKIAGESTALAQPELKAATHHTIDGFTANWEPVTKAESYLLSLYYEDTQGDDSVRSYNESFENLNVADNSLDATNPAIPEGWALNLGDSDQVYTDQENVSDGNYALHVGPNSTSIEMPNNGGRYLSCDFRLRVVNGISELSGDFTGHIYIYGWDGYKWESPGNQYLYIVDNEWHGCDISSIVAGNYYAVKLVFDSFSGCDVAFDDFNWTTTPPAQKVVVQSDIKVEDTSYTFTGLDPYTDYFYTVKAVNDSRGIDSGEPTSAMSAIGVAPPTPNTPTDITDNSYKASWSAVPKATSYQATNYKVYTAPEPIELYEVMNENFSKADSDDIEFLNNLSSLLILNDYTDYYGWYGYITLVGNGGIGAGGDSTYGIAGQIQSPELSLGNGDKSYKVTVMVAGTPGDIIKVMNSSREIQQIQLDSSMQAATLDFHNGIEGDILTFYSYFDESFMLYNVIVAQSLNAGDKVAVMLEESRTYDLETNFDITPLDEPNTTYGFDVQSIYRKYYSNSWSDRSTRSYLTDADSVNNVIDNHDTTTTIFTVSGIKVATIQSISNLSNLHLNPGIYILKQAGKVSKIAIK